MHPNVFMKLSSELQVRCHLSKVQLRNFWTWIQMILRIFCGNKGTVLPFSYWICCFCRFQSAPDFLRFWAFPATCQASACDFSSAVLQLLTSNRRAWGFEQNLLLRFKLNVCDSHKFLKGNLNYNFYQKLKRTPLQIDPRQKSTHWYVETAYITRRQKTCLSSSYLVIESSRKHYVIF